MNKILCKSCGKKTATWLYMPSCSSDFLDYLCDDCVPRGCLCNKEPIDSNWKNNDPNNWEETFDEKGRKFPCCEWSYEKRGWRQ